jgi:uncharacterized protein YdeI (YjbR/CyaY-like superfamily)
MKSEKSMLAFRDRCDWRKWLDRNHSQASEAWIVIQKKGSQNQGLFLAEAVEEALCYGWIDSTLNKIDDQSYLLRFSPRKPNSVWSICNIRRVESLARDGRLMAAGQLAIQAAQDNGQWQAAIDREDPEYLPPDLAAAIKSDPKAWQAFRNLSESRRKRYLYWVQSAKKKETKQKRVTEIMRLIHDDE